MYINIIETLSPSYWTIEYHSKLFVIDIEDIGYHHYRMRSCTGRNEIFLGNVASLYKCADICDQNRQCVSIEWWGVDNPHPLTGSNYCQASSTCTYENSEKSTKYDPADLYVKGTTLSIQYLRENIFLMRVKTIFPY